MIDLIVVGRARGALADAAAEYERRLARYCTLRVRELREEPIRAGDRTAAMERERRRVAPLIEGAWLVALDVGGRQLASEELAEFVRAREET
ncbi:MAG: putative methyltransferase, partial [Gaiellales bacterium]|nr:putative methyltransferase [Gaiellales bacterium]